MATGMNEQWKDMLESKERERKRLATLPFSEKIGLLEQMRARALAISSNPLYVCDQVQGERALLLREKSGQKLPRSSRESFDSLANDCSISPSR